MNKNKNFRTIVAYVLIVTLIFCLFFGAVVCVHMFMTDDTIADYIAPSLIALYIIVYIIRLINLFVDIMRNRK